jgi:hypothetical protein
MVHLGPVIRCHLLQVGQRPPLSTADTTAEEDGDTVSEDNKILKDMQMIVRPLTDR